MRRKEKQNGGTEFEINFYGLEWAEAVIESADGDTITILDDVPTAMCNMLRSQLIGMGKNVTLNVKDK